MKLIVESAPISLTIIDHHGKVMAANQAALTLRGAERLDEVVGKDADATIAPEDHERFAQFVADVCAGKSGSLQYDLLPLVGSPCAVETHAVALRRDATAPPVFLGVTYEAGERKRLAGSLRQAEAKCELLEAQRSDEREASGAAVEAAKAAHAVVFDEARRAQAALKDAKGQHESLAGQWASEREALLAKLGEADDRQALLTAQLIAAEQAGERRVRVALRDANEQHQALAGQWASERDALLAKLQDADDRQASLAAQLIDEQRARESGLAQAESEYQAALTARSGEKQELERVISEMHAGYDEMLNQCRAEQHAATEATQSLQRQCAETIGAWQRELAEVAGPLKDAYAGLERLLQTCQSAPLMPESNGDDRMEDGASTTSLSPADPESDEVAAWRF